MITPMLAAKAYAAVQSKATSGPSDIEGGGGAAGGVNFADMVKNAMNDTVHQSKVAETKMMAGAQGKADLVDVVTAVSSAQASLETVMAVRDQVISAYQEVMRMQI